MIKNGLLVLLLVVTYGQIHGFMEKIGVPMDAITGHVIASVQTAASYDAKDATVAGSSVAVLALLYVLARRNVPKLIRKLGWANTKVFTRAANKLSKTDRMLVGYYMYTFTRKKFTEAGTITINPQVKNDWLTTNYSKTNWDKYDYSLAVREAHRQLRELNVVVYVNVPKGILSNECC